MEITLTVDVADAFDKDVIYDLYCELKESGRLSAFLYEDDSLQAFLDMCYKQWIYLCKIDGEFVGVVVINGFRGANAWFHFCMLPQGDEYVNDFGEKILDAVFSNSKVFSLWGLTPCCYRHVFPVLHKAGFSVLKTLEDACFIKGKFRTGKISCITSYEYKQRNKDESVQLN